MPERHGELEKAHSRCHSWNSLWFGYGAVSGLPWSNMLGRSENEICIARSKIGIATRRRRNPAFAAAGRFAEVTGHDADREEHLCQTSETDGPG